MSRIVVLMHHGDAEEHGLTPWGVREVRYVADQMVRAGFQPDLILTSPADKSVETALLVSEAYEAAGRQVNVKKDIRLRRGSVAGALARLSGEQSVLAITHTTQIENGVEQLTNTQLRGTEPVSAQAIFVSSEQPDWPSAIRSQDSKIVRTLKPFGLEAQT